MLVVEFDFSKESDRILIVPGTMALATREAIVLQSSPIGWRNALFANVPHHHLSNVKRVIEFNWVAVVQTLKTKYLNLNLIKFIEYS